MMMSNMLTVLVWTLASASLSTAATCPGPRGSEVDWWIIFQQSSLPFFHFYVDNTDSHNISFHFPEKDTSVLSQFIDSILTSQYQQYMVYSYDAINVRNIAENQHFPTMLKWMHGILAMDYTLSSGVWLLHNNLLFPPFEAHDLAPPTTKLWYNTVVGDTADNVFYICLSLGNDALSTDIRLPGLENQRRKNLDTDSDVRGALDNILSGNPILLKTQLSPLFYDGKFAQSILSQTSTFALEESAVKFMDCLNASRDETLTNCLFRFSSKGENPVTVTTRSRGTLKTSRGLCYDVTASTTKGVVMVTDSKPETKSFTDMDTMFVMSNDPMTPSYGITCFGQDVTEYTDIVTIMICVELPELHQQLVKASKFTNLLCPVKIKLRKGSDENEKTFSFANSIRHELSKAVTENIPGSKLDDSCDSQLCSVSMETENGESTWKNPLLKMNKMSELYKGLIEMPASSDDNQMGKENEVIEDKIQNKRAMTIDNDEDLQKYIIESEASLLALFCQRSCRYCQPVTEIFHGISQDFDNCQFFIVDANLPTIPPDLQVPYTPYVRFRGHTNRPWVDYDGKKHDILGLATFLSYMLQSSQEMEDSMEENINQVPTVRRRKRSLGKDFIAKHISTNDKMGGTVPTFENVDNVTYDVMTRVRSHYMKRRKWKSYSNIDNFKHTYFVSEDELALRMAIDTSVRNAMPVDSDKQKKSCDVAVHEAERPKYAKMQCSETEPMGHRYSRYYKCVSQISDFSFINMTVVTMRWIKKNRTCIYSREGQFMLGAGLIKNTNVCEINHLYSADLNPEEICE